MTPTKSLFELSPAVFGVVTASLQAVAQQATATHVCRPELGAKWAVARRQRVDFPWAFQKERGVLSDA